MKNRVLLKNYYLPGDLERQIEALVDFYNNQRYHESLNNVTPADVYFGRDKAILREREKSKRRQRQMRGARLRGHDPYRTGIWTGQRRRYGRWGPSGGLRSRKLRLDHPKRCPSSNPHPTRQAP